MAAGTQRGFRYRFPLPRGFRRRGTEETVFARAAPTAERPSGHELTRPGPYPGHAVRAITTERLISCPHPARRRRHFPITTHSRTRARRGTPPLRSAQVATVMAPLRGSVTGLRDAQAAGRTLFPGVPGRICPEVFGNCTGELSKADGSPQRRWATPNPFRARTEQKDGEKVNPVSARAETSVSSCPWTRAVLVLGPWDSDGHPLLPGSQALRLGPDHITGVPGSPPCRRQTAHLLSLHSHVSRFSD